MPIPVAEDQEARIVCHADTEKSFIVEGEITDLTRLLENRGIAMSPKELEWIAQNGGAENDMWRVRIVPQGEMLEEDEERAIRLDPYFLLINGDI